MVEQVVKQTNLWLTKYQRESYVQGLAFEEEGTVRPLPKSPSEELQFIQIGLAPPYRTGRLRSPIAGDESAIPKGHFQRVMPRMSCSTQ